MEDSRLLKGIGSTLLLDHIIVDPFAHLQACIASAVPEDPGGAGMEHPCAGTGEDTEPVDRAAISLYFEIVVDLIIVGREYVGNGKLAGNRICRLPGALASISTQIPSRLSRVVGLTVSANVS